ncbi:UDP-N-acetylglucosamine 2-epimerase [Aquamicrobium defluvii]|uniref:UDP-N-acetylglucosamine 2-epimerase n=1 Tax=Aquamicrobium defluvii TaxID=69279 RepID=UPI001AADF5EC
MDIPQPDYNLGICGGTHGVVSGHQLESIDDVLISEKPDWGLVYGDTNSTLLGVLVAVKPPILASSLITLGKCRLIGDVMYDAPYSIVIAHGSRYGFPLSDLRPELHPHHHPSS